MTHIKESGFKLSLLLIPLFIFCSCKSYRFLPNGTLISDGYDNYYYNDSAKLGIEIPGDFYVYQKKKNNGVKFSRLYKDDKKILKQLNVNRQDVKVLFSATPNIEPNYNLLVVINDIEIEKFDLQNFDLNKSGKSYFRTQIFENKELYQAIIPFGKKSLSFFYYADTTTTCHFFDVKKLVEKSAKYLDKKKNLNFLIKKDKCPDSVVVRVNIPQKKVIMRDASLVYIYELNNDESKTFKSFKILKKGESNFNLFLCKNNSYVIEYMELNHDSVWKHSIKPE